VGLALGNLCQQPWGQVVGPYLTLLVASRETNAVAITFALTAHRLVTSVGLPIVGRLSDKSTGRSGRRVPLIASGTAVAAVAVAAMTRTHGYWPLFACIVVARVALQLAIIGRVGVTPDVFGRQRWAKAAGAVAIVGFLPGVVMLGVIRSTWKQNDPSSWSLTFLLAAGGLAIGAACVALFVREAPAAQEVAEVAAAGSWRTEIDRLRAIPNARRLLVAGALLAASLAATSRLLPVWARDQLHLGGAGFANVTLALGVIGVVLVPIGVVLGSRAHPRLLAVSAAIVGAISAAACAEITDVRWFVGLTALTVPLTVAAGVALVPQFIDLFPKGDSVGQAFGQIAGPVGMLTAAVALATAVVVDAVGSTSAIWFVSAALLVALAVVFAGLRIEDGARTDVRDLLRRARHAGLRHGLFDGTVGVEDVLGAATSSGQAGSR
jgi:MFS family permease